MRLLNETMTVWFIIQSSHKSLKVLESPGIWKVSWKVLGFINFYEKSWKCAGILHNIYLINFLFQVVYILVKLSCKIFQKIFIVYLPASRIKMPVLRWELRCHCCQYGRDYFNPTYERQKAPRKVSFWPVYQIIDATYTSSPFDRIEN